MDNKTIYNKFKHTAFTVTGELEKKIKNLDRALTLTVFVLLVGFVTMIIAVFAVFISATSERNTTYQLLQDKVQSQNDNIDALTNEITELTKVLQDGQETIQKTN